jgi:predicted Mrr-cat superfamily restriction endonuclease
MTVWRLITHHKDPEQHFKWAKERGQIAIGWNGVGDLNRYESEAEIKQAVHETGNKNWPFSGKQLLAFRDGIKRGDLVILSTGKQRGAVMRIDGEYEFTRVGLSDDVEYAHRRRATVVPLSAEALWKAAGGPAKGQNARWTLVLCQFGVTPGGERINDPQMS